MVFEIQSKGADDLCLEKKIKSAGQMWLFVLKHEVHKYDNIQEDRLKLL